MDIFQYFLSYQSENTSTFSDIFRIVREFHQLLGQKSYLLNHYLSMFFRLIVKMDFCTLGDEIDQFISDLQKKIQDDLENSDSSIPRFDCQETSTEMGFRWTALADSLLKQALKEFYHEYIHSYRLSADLVDFGQTEEKLIEYLGKSAWGKFQQQLINCSPYRSSMRLFCQDIIIEITKRFLPQDLETNQEVPRLSITHFIHNKSD